MINGEVSHADDDLVQQLLGGLLGAVLQQGADDVSERQGQTLGSQDRLKKGGAGGGRQNMLACFTAKCSINCDHKDPRHNNNAK